MVKSTVEISQNFVAFSEYMNFKCYSIQVIQGNKCFDYELRSINSSSVLNRLYNRDAGGGGGGTCPSQVLADQLTLSRPGGTHYPYPVLPAPPDFWPLLHPCIWQKIVHWFTFSVHENYKLRAWCVHKLVFVLIFITIYVHDMFWACNFHVLNL